MKGNVATVGISQFAVDQLTDLIMIELPAVGTRLVAGKSFGEIESVKAVSDLYAPVGGEVIEVNSDVADNVQLLAEDPYDKGWLIKLRVDDPAEISRADGPRRLREESGRGSPLSRARSGCQAYVAAHIALSLGRDWPTRFESRDLSDRTAIGVFLRSGTHTIWRISRTRPTTSASC